MLVGLRLRFALTSSGALPTGVHVHRLRGAFAFCARLCVVECMLAHMPQTTILGMRRPLWVGKGRRMRWHVCMSEAWAPVGVAIASGGAGCKLGIWTRLGCGYYWRCPLCIGHRIAMALLETWRCHVFALGGHQTCWRPCCASSFMLGVRASSGGGSQTQCGGSAYTSVCSPHIALAAAAFRHTWSTYCSLLPATPPLLVLSFGLCALAVSAWLSLGIC